MNLDQFLDKNIDTSPYSDIVCLETRRRIRLSLAAYAYEALMISIMSDNEFDKLAQSIDLTIDTRRPDLDKWFRKNFQPHTGMWIHGHPDRKRLHIILEQFIINQKEI